jgi:Amiloride-sensitive sodium channel
MLLGLFLILKSERSEYLCSSESVGFRIAIHQAAEMPFPDISGYSLPPGYITNVAVSQVRPGGISRLHPISPSFFL